MPVTRRKGQFYVEGPRTDEVAAGVPASGGASTAGKRATLAAVKRRPTGTVADSESAVALGRLGGRAKAAKARGVAKLIALTKLDIQPDHPFYPYLLDAVDLQQVHCARLAATVGDGECGEGPSLEVAMAVLEFAKMQYTSDAGISAPDSPLRKQFVKAVYNTKAGSSIPTSIARVVLGTHNFWAESREHGRQCTQHLLAAEHQCAREAVARRAAQPANVHTALIEAFGQTSPLADATPTDPTDADGDEPRSSSTKPRQAR